MDSHLHSDHISHRMDEDLAISDFSSVCRPTHSSHNCVHLSPVTGISGIFIQSHYNMNMKRLVLEVEI